MTQCEGNPMWRLDRFPPHTNFPGVIIVNSSLGVSRSIAGQWIPEGQLCMNKEKLRESRSRHSVLTMYMIDCSTFCTSKVMTRLATDTSLSLSLYVNMIVDSTVLSRIQGIYCTLRETVSSCSILHWKHVCHCPHSTL